MNEVEEEAEEENEVKEENNHATEEKGEEVQWRCAEIRRRGTRQSSKKRACARERTIWATKMAGHASPASLTRMGRPASTKTSFVSAKQSTHTTTRISSAHLPQMFWELSGCPCFESSTCLLTAWLFSDFPTLRTNFKIVITIARVLVRWFPSDTHSAICTFARNACNTTLLRGVKRRLAPERCMGDISELGLGIGEIRRGATHRVADFWRMFFSLKNYDYRYMYVIHVVEFHSTLLRIFCAAFQYLFIVKHKK